MLIKDLTQKILEDYDDVFSDIVNVLIFDGERYVKANELENAQVVSQYKANDNRLHEQERDISKYFIRNREKELLIGIENQNAIDYNMPLRVLGYDGASYKIQYTSDEAIYPVITLVLYFGDTHWNTHKKLSDVVNVPDEVDEYFNDYEINVFEIAWLTDEQVEKFTSDFKIVARFFVERRKNKEYIPNDTTVIKHTDELLKLLSVMTQDRRYEEILLNQQKGEIRNMCDVAQRLEDIGMQKGMQKGKLELMAGLVMRGIFSVEDGANEIGSTPTELNEIINQLKGKQCTL